MENFSDENMILDSIDYQITNNDTTRDQISCIILLPHHFKLLSLALCQWQRNKVLCKQAHFTETSGKFDGKCFRKEFTSSSTLTNIAMAKVVTKVETLSVCALKLDIFILTILWGVIY